MKIIALKGGNSCGKSTTLNLVYDELIRRGGTSTPRVVIGNPSHNDFECIVTYLSKTIGFYTMGDYSGYTINAIKKYASIPVDILILATNDRFVKPTIEISKYPNNILTKTIATPVNIANNMIANQTDCATIISLI
ncbi:hypothetical protein CMU96_17470 [Elizabethkingia anophelis]|nr:hypothetical protein [Elizabethkingia anophelis]MDV2467219.1 hypothetical protein [Elizabethkingia anophelis]MDV3529511.1 hypothetical protein [Elizabethkingia anophelis]MDV3821270.1 hypothetical protein [Elizabethkingia anophelis]MDV3849544.1 hypothetical protein [Elizabethkingia anophelis]